MDLPDPAERLEESGQFRPPDRDPDPVIALAQGADHAAAQKPRSAENRDESFQIRCHGSHSCGKECVLSGLYRASLRCAIGIPKPGSRMN
ncbi:hypothetical protein TM233_49680 [Bradyrhizobium sp. TM233]|nr:hypothetical protein TM233_49680 [Bradyrhizobium sp. TM233]